VGCHYFGAVEIASIEDDRVAQFAAELLKVQGRKLLPFRENQKRIGSGRGFVRIFRKLHAGRQYLASPFHGGRVISSHRAAFLHQGLY